MDNGRITSLYSCLPEEGDHSVFKLVCWRDQIVAYLLKVLQVESFGQVTALLIFLVLNG